MKEIADYFDVHYITVSRSVKSFEQNANDSGDVAMVE